MKSPLRPARAVGLLAVLAMAGACSDQPMSPLADDNPDPLASLVSGVICR